jgi:hypothetical protein
LSNTRPRLTRYESGIIFNKRCRIEDPDKEKYAVGVHYSASRKKALVEFSLPSSNSSETSSEDNDYDNTDFMHAVMQIKACYVEALNEPDHLLHAIHELSKKIPTLPEDWLDGNAVDIPVPCLMDKPTVSLSSLGVLDKIVDPQIGPFEVYNPWVTGEELRNCLGCFLSMFRGELCFSAAYNEAWHDMEQVEEFLKKCLDVVLTGLGLRSGLGANELARPST